MKFYENFDHAPFKKISLNLFWELHKVNISYIINDFNNVLGSESHFSVIKEIKQ